MIKKIIVTLIIISSSLISFATDIEIRYYNPTATKVILFWGINDWQPVSPLPASTILKNKMMYSVMKREGDEFVFKVSLLKNNVMDYGFNYFKPEGPFNLKVEYWDFNGYPDKKFYHTSTNNNQLVKLNSDPKNSFIANNISLLKFALFYSTIICLFALIIFGWRRFYLKVEAAPLNSTSAFASLGFTLLFSLLFIRAFVVELAYLILINPLHYFPSLLKVFFDDFLFAIILGLVFGGLFFLLKRRHKAVLVGFSFIVIFVVLLAVLNSKVISVIGKPFNYQWLYYSDFLKSNDASKAIAANVGSDLYVSCGLLLFSIFPLCWLMYLIQNKKPWLLPSIMVLFIAIGFFSKARPTSSKLKRVNPFLYFISSLQTSESINDKDNSLAKESEFNQKNKEALSFQNTAAFQSAKIKNVLLFVLESTPAEYLSVYNPSLQSTPFLNSIKNNSVIFDAAYAHVPSTNKSMFSIFCSSYPELTYKSVTYEKPDIEMPSITSELDRYGYRSSFINSGDNSYQNAAGFLAHRKIGEIQDFRNNSCGKVFSDQRYKNQNLDGVDDSCLSVRFFNWLGKDNDQPFFSMMWTFQTHYPYFTSGKNIDFGVDNPSLNKYLNALHRADETLRDIVVGLKQRNLLESTLIVVMGDHGEAFGRHGQTTHAAGIYEENLHIPLLFYNPLLFKGEHIGYPVGISDIAPSIFSILQKPVPEIWQGENVFSTNRRKRIYFMSPYSDILFGFREDHYKFIYNASDNSFALYDLNADPFETKNIADAHPDFVKNGNRQVQAWIQYQRQFMKKIIK